MGGPSTIPEVYGFLSRLFADGDLIPLGRFQNWLGPLIARRRTPMIERHYTEIGGGSPIRKWSELQAQKICERLDKLSPQTGTQSLKTPLSRGWYICRLGLTLRSPSTVRGIPLCSAPDRGNICSNAKRRNYPCCCLLSVSSVQLFDHRILIKRITSLDSKDGSGRTDQMEYY
jgi:hypothetical protein